MHILQVNFSNINYSLAQENLNPKCTKFKNYDVQKSTNKGK